MEAIKEVGMEIGKWKELLIYITVTIISCI